MAEKTSNFFIPRTLGPLLSLLICCGKIALFSQTSFHAALQLNDRLSLPFEVVYCEGKAPKLAVVNGEERIDLRFLLEKKDSMYFEFPEIAGQSVFHKTERKGYWLNLNKTLPTKIPFEFYAAQSPAHNVRLDLRLDSLPQVFNGTYDVLFTDANGTEKAIGIFQQHGAQIEGTFRTETGDYRFLSGGVVNGKMKVSCFDGVHAFLFEAQASSGNGLSGTFYSGMRYQASWTGVLNPNAELISPYSISRPLTERALLILEVKNSKGKKRTLDQRFFQGEPSVVQIMGTWCPNCLDETRYFMSLKEKNAFKSVRFVMVGFENGANDKDRLQRLKKYARKMDLNYGFYLGGEASTKQAGIVFNALNGVFSFPTTLFLNNKGEIVQVHSGFDGPGTGVHFTHLQEATEALLLKLLEE
ncbi:MAG: TlpA family protein disulfide reductase [Bacteroidota bacterium]